MLPLMADSPLTLLDQKVFVPSKNFELSLSFYQALGWTLNWRHEGGLAELEFGNHRFFLQKYYQKDWAENFMIYLNVSDVEAWYAHIQSVLAVGTYPGARVKAPERQDHGGIVCYVWDPCGVLLHVAEDPTL